MEYKEILKNNFGISYLRPHQELIIDHVLEQDESNLLALLPTGGGKSLCFMLPILVKHKLTIIIYPLISLINDQRNRFEKASIPYEVIIGGMDRFEKLESLKRLLQGESLALITNIEMLVALNSSGLLSMLKNKVDMLVIDEAHTVETWGNTFRTAFKELKAIRTYIKPKHTLAFTATADTKIIEGLKTSIFNDEDVYILKASSNRENIFYEAIIPLNKFKQILYILKNKESRPALVFARSRKEAEELSLNLQRYFKCKYYHAGLDKDEKKAIERWFEENQNSVLVATIAFGLGIDVGAIRTVIHTYLIEDATNYLQEAGRAGRDGKESKSYILYYPWEKSPLKTLFDSSKCIRTGLLNAMNEETDEINCLGCNHCVRQNEKRIGEREILRFIRFHPFRKRAYITRMLSSANIFTRPFRLHNWSEKDISRAMNILILEKRIRIVQSRFVISLTKQNRRTR